MKKKIISVMICSVLLLCVACGSKDKTFYEYKKSDINTVNFQSSDQGFASFISEFFDRHTVTNGKESVYISEQVLGQSSYFAKEWETLALSFFDGSKSSYALDRVAAVTQMLTNNPQDKFGYIWNGTGELEQATSPKQGSFAQGWPFPYTGTNNGGTHYTEYVPEFEFNKDNSEGWTVEVDKNLCELNGDVATLKNGLLTANVSEATEIRFASSDFNKNEQIATFMAPFIELDMRMMDSDSFGNDSSIDDIIIEIKLSDDKIIELSQKEYNTIPKNISAAFLQRMYFAAYLNEDYDTNYDNYIDGTALRIKSVDVVVRAKENCKINGEINLNYIRFQADKRQANNAEILISGIKNMFEFSQNIDFLRQNIVRARKAMNFYLYCLNGESGLCSINFVGHNALQEEGNGIGNGYWDIQSTPESNIYSNIYFYKALKSMEYLEQIASELKLDVDMPSTYAQDNKTIVKYSQTAQSLNDLAKQVKLNCEKELDDGGFWNPETGRFATGVDMNGKAIDYGYTIYNLEAVAVGLGTDEQALSIMDWVSGKRIVETDDSKGEDIYYFEFAPRNNTLDNRDNLFWAYSPINYGEQVQNGGAVLFLAYYDLLSRVRVYGIENAFDRFKAIQTWYNKVQSAGGDGATFYQQYYESSDDYIVLEGWNGQGGAIGVDAVFLESSVLFKAVPEIFFNMKSKSNKVLSFAPDFPKKLDNMKIENCLFNKVVYDVSAGNQFLQINSVKGNASSLSIEVKLKIPNKNYKVYYKGKVLTNYEEKDGYIIATIPFASGKLAIK